MVSSLAIAQEPETDTAANFDAVVIGAGVSAASGYGFSNRERESAAPGTGTAIPAPASIRKAGPTATRFLRNCWRNGTGRSTSPVSPKTSGT